jgi:hypothetical protein
MKIIFYKAKHGRWIDKLIAMATFSKYSHCELLFPDGLCRSASKRDGGIRTKKIDIDYRWDCFDLTGEYDVAAMLYWFEINKNDTYDYYGPIGSMFGLDLTSENKKFCSYVCAIVLGLNPIITPGGLYRVLKKTGTINV